MVIKQATEQDFAYAFSFIEKLWDYNVYDKEIVKSVYKEVLADDKSFAFFCKNIVSNRRGEQGK